MSEFKLLSGFDSIGRANVLERAIAGDLEIKVCVSSHHIVIPCAKYEEIGKEFGPQAQMIDPMIVRDGMYSFEYFGYWSRCPQHLLEFCCGKSDFYPVEDSQQAAKSIISNRGEFYLFVINDQGERCYVLESHESITTEPPTQIKRVVGFGGHKFTEDEIAVSGVFENTSDLIAPELQRQTETRFVLEKFIETTGAIRGKPALQRFLIDVIGAEALHGEKFRWKDPQGVTHTKSMRTFLNLLSKIRKENNKDT